MTINAFFFVVFGFQFVKGNRHAALLEINLLRYSGTKHILSPLGNRLDIDEVLNAHVLGNGVAAPGTTAQRKREETA